jgi:hypothetical protein
MVLRKPVLRAGWLLSSHPARVDRAGAATRGRAPRPALAPRRVCGPRAHALGGDWGGALPWVKVPSQATKRFRTESNKTIDEF